MTEKSLPSSFTQFAPLVLASQQVTGPDRLPVCFAFRVEPNNESDSGWIFWSGQEDQDYIDEPSNTIICPLISFIEMDHSIEDVTHNPIGTAWERDNLEDTWREVVGYFAD